MLPGGAAAKAGERYERSWTLLKLLDILEEDATRIKIEPVGDAGVGVEFWLELSDGRVQWHQVKRQTAANDWAIGALRDVLIDFGPRLRSGDECVFVSQLSAGRLSALCDRASSLSFEEFMAHLSGPMKSDLDRLCTYWGAPDAEAYGMLRLLSVETVPSRFVDLQFTYRVRSLVECEPAMARQALEDQIAGSLHGELTASDLWKALRHVECQPRSWIDSTALRANVAELADAFLRRVERRLPAGLVPHPALDRVLQIIDAGARRVLIVGAAGSGKTVICSQVVANEIEQGRLAVPLSADRLPSVNTTDALGGELGLQASPAAVLARLSPADRSLLVIDQLDAVSQVSGRDLDRFDLLADLVAEADALSNVVLVIACRDFDLRNDPDLKALAKLKTTETVEMAELDEEYVTDVLSGVGEFEIDALLLDFLRLPLHLSLFLEVHEDLPDPSAVPTLQDLYGHYWDTKRLAVAQIVGSDQWVEVIDRIIEEMNRRETLALPETLLDEYATQIAAMVSEGVLDSSDGRVAFFHETFFDYCFARRFVASGAPLSEFLAAADDQGLFIRSQVRQVLSYRRAEDRTKYLDDLAYLVSANGVRPHLRSIVFGLLGELREPQDDEWAVVKDAVSGPPSKLHLPFWAGAGRSSSWFRVIDATGSWYAWLNSDDDGLVRRTLWVLRGAVGAFPDRVVDLLRPVAEQGGERPAEVVEALAAADFEGGEPVARLVLEILDRNSELGSLRIQMGLAKLADRDANLALDVIVELLSRDVETQRNGEGPFSGSGKVIDAAGSEYGMVETVAQQIPGPFVSRVLPLLLEAIMRSPAGAVADGDRSNRWFYGKTSEPRDLSDQLYDAVLGAFDLLGSPSSPDLDSSIAILKESGSLGAANLLARCYIAAAADYAEDAAAWLLSDPSLLDLGDGSVPHWLSRELLGAISPCVSSARFEALMVEVLDHYPPWEKEAGARRWRGLGQLTLLQGIPSEQRTPRINHRIGELGRKLGKEDVDAPGPLVMGGVVGPPIAPEAAQKMTDEQWLGAIAKYDSEDSQSSDFLKGGARELARLFEAEIKNDPPRYASLFLQFPENTADAYYEQALVAFADCDLEDELLGDISRMAYQYGGEGARRWLVRLIEKNAGSVLLDELLQIVLEIVQSDPDPRLDSWKPEGGATQYYGGDIDFAGLNSTRGAAALAIASLVLEDHARLETLMPGVESALSDDVEAVRACGFQALVAVLAVDPELAVEMFLRVIDDTPDGVLGSRHLERFIYWAARTHLAELFPTLERMLGMFDESVRQIACRQLALASLSDASLDPTVDICLQGEPYDRKACVEVFARNVSFESRRDRVISVLSDAFDDPDKDVRDAAQRVFSEFCEVSLLPFTGMLERFADSRTFRDPDVWVFGSLGDGESEIPETAVYLCERWLAMWSDDVGDISTHAAGEAQGVAKVALRLYAQRPSSEVRRRCLDVIDRLVETGAYGIDRELETAR